MYFPLTFSVARVPACHLMSLPTCRKHWQLVYLTLPITKHVFIQLTQPGSSTGSFFRQPTQSSNCFNQSQCFGAAMSWVPWLYVYPLWRAATASPCCHASWLHASVCSCYVACARNQTDSMDLNRPATSWSPAPAMLVAAALRRSQGTGGINAESWRPL
jgi:hypothetical protein